jgi:hypothetical protein
MELAKKHVSPDHREEPISLEDVGLDGPNLIRRRGRAVKTFKQWTENEPKEKWCLMFDEGGARHGIKTTNFADAYNTVLRGARLLPLVGTIEFLLYCTMQYFYDRIKAAHAAMRTSITYNNRMTEYSDAAHGKALLHLATPTPLHRPGSNEIEWTYEVQCKGKSRLGSSCERRSRFVGLGNETCKCTCNKP